MLWEHNVGTITIGEREAEYIYKELKAGQRTRIGDQFKAWILAANDYADIGDSQVNPILEKFLNKVPDVRWSGHGQRLGGTDAEAGFWMLC